MLFIYRLSLFALSAVVVVVVVVVVVPLRFFVSKVWLFKRVEKNSNFGGLKKNSLGFKNCQKRTLDYFDSRVVLSLSWITLRAAVLCPLEEEEKEDEKYEEKQQLCRPRWWWWWYE